MGSSWVRDGHLPWSKTHFPLSLDEETMDLGGITVFKAPELPGKKAVEGVGDHGHDHIKMHLDQYGGRKRVEVEEMDGLGDYILHTPTPGVVSHEQLCGRREVIGDEKGGLFMPVSTHDHLAQIPLVVG